jgi:hypothetical protein
MAWFEKLSRRTVVVLAILVVAALVLLALWTWPTRAEGAALQPADSTPFSQAAAQLRAQVSQVSDYRAEKTASVTADNRANVVDRIVESAVFLQRNGDATTVVNLTAYPLALADFRALVDATVELQDVVFNVSWTIAGKPVKTVGVATSAGAGKFEPILYTSVSRTEDSDSTAPARGRAPGIANLFDRWIEPALHAAATPPPFVRVYNFFNVNVVTGELVVVNHPGRSWPGASLEIQSLPLWKGEGGPVESRSYWNKKQKCVNALVNFKWYSFIPLQELGKSVKLGEGLPLFQASKLLSTRVCQ